MILYPNTTITVYRWDTYATEVDAGIDVYIYENTDTQDAMNGVEGAQNELRLLTVFSWLRIGDKVVDSNTNAYIIKKVKHRNSFVSDFYEVQIRSEND